MRGFDDSQPCLCFAWTLDLVGPWALINHSVDHVRTPSSRHTRRALVSVRVRGRLWHPALSRTCYIHHRAIRGARALSGRRIRTKSHQMLPNTAAVRITIGQRPCRIAASASLICNALPTATPTGVPSRPGRWPSAIPTCTARPYRTVHMRAAVLYRTVGTPRVRCPSCTDARSCAMHVTRRMSTAH